MTPACVIEGARSSQIYYGCVLWSSVLHIQNSVTPHSPRATWDERRWHNTPDMQSHTHFRCVEWDERFDKRWDDQDGWRQHYLVIWLNHCTITRISWRMFLKRTQPIRFRNEINTTHMFVLWRPQAAVVIVTAAKEEVRSVYSVHRGRWTGRSVCSGDCRLCPGWVLQVQLVQKLVSESHSKLIECWGFVMAADTTFNPKASVFYEFRMRLNRLSYKLDF